MLLFYSMYSSNLIRVTYGVLLFYDFNSKIATKAVAAIAVFL